MATFWTVLTVAVLVTLFWVGKEYGRVQQSNFDRRFDFRREEKIMASLSRIETAVNAVLAVVVGQATQIADLKTQVAALQGTQENPADQAKLDELAGKLEAATQPPA